MTLLPNLTAELFKNRAEIILFHGAGHNRDRVVRNPNARAMSSQLPQWAVMPIMPRPLRGIFIVFKTSELDSIDKRFPCAEIESAQFSYQNSDVDEDLADD